MIPPLSRIFLLLFESAEIATFTPQEKIKLEYDMRTERDLRNQIAYAREEGYKEGLKLYREDLLNSIAERMRELGHPEDLIAEVTTLPENF